MKIDYALLTDLYQLTMAQGYWETGQGDTQACFHMYFRDYPFKGGYAIACGMAQLADL
ncbi:nicotinate phosphoribosyltransferase, partial [Eggerthella lenta]